MVRLILLAVLSSTVGGCISLKKHEAELDAVQGQLEATRNELQAEGDARSQAERDIAGLQAELDAAQAELDRYVTLAGDLETQVEDVQAALQELQARQARAQEMLASYTRLAERFRSLIDAGTLELRMVDGRMLVELATDILFPPGSARLSRDGRTAVRQVGEVLTTVEDRDFQVVGHTDDRPIHTEAFPSNWHLGAVRAIAVTQLLIEAGMPEGRLTVASAASHQPIADNRTPGGRAANRRIEIIVQPDLSVLQEDMIGQPPSGSSPVPPQ